MIHMDVEIPLTEEAYDLIAALKEIELYAAGGVVRDFLFNHYHGHNFRPKDVDFATPEKPDKILELLHKANIKTLEVGKAFGVVVAVMPSREKLKTGIPFEIATFRQDQYELDGDGRRPDDVQFITSPKEDAKRRDLTINGLFYDPREKKILDFVAGIADVQNIIIRPIGDPRERYREDRLRVMRTVRFFCRYRRGDIDEGMTKETISAISEFKDMEGVSEERIVTEFKSGLESSLYPPHYLQCCQKLGLLPAIFQDPINEDMIPLTKTRNHVVALAMLIPDKGKAAMRWLHDLKYDSLTIKTVVFLRSLLEFRRDEAYDYWKRRKSFEDQERLCDEIMVFSSIVGKSLEEMKRIMSFQPRSSASDFPDIEEGPELGLAIKNAINEEYIKLCE